MQTSFLYCCIFLLIVSSITSEVVQKQTPATSLSESSPSLSSPREFSFCLLPEEIPSPYSPFAAYLTLIFVNPPINIDISFLQIDETNTVFLGNFISVDVDLHTIVLMIHNGESDFFGFDSEIFNDFEFVVGKVTSSSDLISISLTLQADLFLPGLANDCPNLEEMPFQLIPFYDYSEEESSIELTITELDNDSDSDNEPHHHHHHNSSSSKDHQKDNTAVILLSIAFAILILISCLSSSYVIYASIKNDKTDQKPNVEEEEIDDHVPEREFLV